METLAASPSPILPVTPRSRVSDLRSKMHAHEHSNEFVDAGSMHQHEGLASLQWDHPQQQSQHQQHYSAIMKHPTDSESKPHSYNSHTSRSRISAQSTTPIAQDSAVTSQQAPERQDTEVTTPKSNSTRFRTPLSVRVDPYTEHKQPTDTLSPTSPMSITSPTHATTNGASIATTTGAKRTASGDLKSLPNTPLSATFSHGHGRERTYSSTSSTSSRAGDLALALKARLGYAMAKVQRGWEDKGIDEVEDLAAGTKMNGMGGGRHSMSHLAQGTAISNGWAHGPGFMSQAPAYETTEQRYAPAFSPEITAAVALEPSKRHSGSYGHGYSSSTSSSQPTSMHTSAPRLQPAADIRPFSSSQPQLRSAGHRYSHSHSHRHSYHPAYPPTTPPRRLLPNGHSATHGHQHRPPTIRTEKQTAEAEQEALQALFQLGSPQNSQFSPDINGLRASAVTANGILHGYTNGYAKPDNNHNASPDLGLELERSQGSQDSLPPVSPMQPGFPATTTGTRRVTFAPSEVGSDDHSDSEEDDVMESREQGGEVLGARDGAVGRDVMVR